MADIKCYYFHMKINQVNIVYFKGIFCTRPTKYMVKLKIYMISLPIKWVVKYIISETKDYEATTVLKHFKPM